MADQLLADIRERLQSVELTTEELEGMISLHEGRDTKIPLELNRMNVVGTLRSMGYVIPRRRGYYKIIGFKDKEVVPTVDQWPDCKRRLVDEFLDLPAVDINQLRDYLATYSEIPGHGFTAGELLTYQLAKDVGRQLPDGSIGIMKFPNLPRFRVHFPGVGALSLSDQFAQISLRDVKLVNTDPDRVVNLHRFTSYQKGREAVYDCDYLVNGGMEKLINSGNRHALRHNLREIKYLSVREFVDIVGEGDAQSAMFALIDTWRAGPAGLKQRQLAITRDYRAVTLALEDKTMSELSFVGTRDLGANLCCMQIADQLPGRTEYVAQLVEKSLNYPTQTGGYNGTSNANIYLACQKYTEMGVKYINGGSYSGGTDGLTHHKQILAAPNLDVRPQEFILTNHHYDPLKTTS